MAKFGDTLRFARKRRGISLAQISESTKISQRYLQALETGAFGDLPGGIFNKGYVRAYAKLVGLDVESMVQMYEAAAGEKATATDPLPVWVPAERRDRDRRRAMPVALVVALALAVAGGLGAAAWTFLGEEPEATIAAAPPVRPIERAPVPRAEPVPVPREGAPAPAPVEPAARPAEPVAVPVSVPASGLAVPDHGVGRAVAGNELRGRSDRFEPGDRVWFWTRVVGGASGDRIQHVWMRDGLAVETVELRVGGSHWRTYSAMHMSATDAGNWTVEARGADGRVLARGAFVCAGS
jgi:hypothetical protein